MTVGKRGPLHFETTVGTSAVVIEGTQYPGFVMHNSSGNTVYLGGSAVTAAVGWSLRGGDFFSPPDSWHKALRGQNEQRLYGIAGEAGNDIKVLSGPFSQA